MLLLACLAALWTCRTLAASSSAPAPAIEALLGPLGPHDSSLRCVSQTGPAADLGSAGQQRVHAAWPAAPAAAARRSSPSWPAVSLPGAGLLLMAAGLPLFAAQSFLALGDQTPASLWLAAATALLPVLLLAGLLRGWRQRRGAGGAGRLDALAMLALLQAIGVLAAWGLWPLRLWM